MDILDWTVDVSDPEDSIAHVHGLMSGVEKIELIQEYDGTLTHPHHGDARLYALIASFGYTSLQVSHISRLFRTRNPNVIWSYMQRPQVAVGFGGVNFGEVAYVFAQYLDACAETILTWNKIDRY
jgi:uncharacterized protein with HEPN domain